MFFYQIQGEIWLEPIKPKDGESSFCLCQGTLFATFSMKNYSVAEILQRKCQVQVMHRDFQARSLNVAYLSHLYFINLLQLNALKGNEMNNQLQEQRGKKKGFIFTAGKSIPFFTSIYSDCFLVWSSIVICVNKIFLKKLNPHSCNNILQIHTRTVKSMGQTARKLETCHP